MIRSHTKSQAQEYQIKHRLTGAAIIVGFAIVVISVLLQEPSVSTKTQFGNRAGDARQTFQIESLPLNTGNVDPVPAGDSASVDGDNANPALLGSKLEPKIDTPLDSLPATKNPKDAGNIVLTKEDKPNSATNPVSPDESSRDISTNGIGWAVRVGTFSKTENVSAISALLKSHGFNAQYTTVQTTSGTATRIWLGPYTKKKTAEKISIRLQAITGEQGYVIKQPS